MTVWNERPKELAPTGTSPLSALLLEKSRLKSRPRFVKELLSDVQVPTSSPGRFSLALEVGREKALVLTGHMTTKHPEFVGVQN